MFKISNVNLELSKSYIRYYIYGFINYRITITLLEFLKSPFNLFQTPNFKRAYPPKIEASLFCFSHKRKQQSSPYIFMVNSKNKEASLC